MKITSLAAVTVALALSLTGCSIGSSTAPPTQSKNSSAEAATPAAPAENAKTSKYSVVIGDSQLAADYEGKPVLIVNYTYTNNSDKPTSFMLAVSDKAFQGGIELSGMVIFPMTSASPVDSSLLMADVKPGATLQLKDAYILRDKSEVDVEVKELFSFDDSTIATKKFTV